MPPLMSTELKLRYFGLSLTASPTRPNPKIYAIIMRVNGLTRLLSIAYFAPIPTPKTSTTIPILLIRFSPMNFSRSSRADSVYDETKRENVPSELVDD